MAWESVQDYVAEYGYWAVAVGTLWDQSGLQSFAVAGGAYASIDSRFSLLGAILAAAAGSFASDMILWGIGRWRATWLERFVKSNKGRMRLKVLEQGMNKYAMPLLTFGRFLPWIGRFVPAAAGLRRVHGVRVLTWAAIGSVTSSAGYATLGYYAAETVAQIEQYAIFILIGALAISFPIAALVLKRFDAIVLKRLAEEQGEQAEDIKLEP